VDGDAVRAVAQRYTGAADILNRAVHAHLGGLRFNGMNAGRAHTAWGDELHGALARLATSVAQWARANAEIAATLRAESHRCIEAEFRSAALLP